jgi:hypothetical protein
MKRSEFIEKICLASDDELYDLAKKYIIQDFTGFGHNSWKAELLYEECRNRGVPIYDEALEDALPTIMSIMNLEAGCRIERVLKCDRLTESEIKRISNQILELTDEQVIDSLKIEAGDLAQLLGIKKENFYFCLVEGDSMEKANIFDGDMVIYDAGAAKAEDGQIIVLSVYNEYFIKRLKIANGILWLQSENDKYSAARITDDMNIRIIGIVKHVVRGLI